MKRTLLVVLLAAIPAGCGGAGATVAPPLSAPPESPHLTAAATISVTIPPPRQTSGARRRPAYISSSTNSMVVTPQGQSPIVIALTATSPGCSVVAGARQCTVTASLPVGTYPVTVALYWTTNGTASPLAMTTTTQTIVMDTTNTLNFTLNAVVSLVTVSLSPGSTFTAGTAATKTITVGATDPAGATIVVGTDALIDANGSAVTIQLGDTDTSGATSVSPTTAGATPSTLSYNGTTTPNGTNVTATAKNASNVTVATAQASFTVTPSTTTAPPWTISRYVQNVSYSTLYAEGQAMASQGQSGLVVLDFGQPWYCEASQYLCSGAPVGSYGSFLPNGVGTYVTIANITAAAEAYLDGYNDHKVNSTQQLHLAIGTNNFCKYMSDCQSFPFYGHGYAWAGMINALAAYVASVPGRSLQEFVSGANDIEPIWGIVTDPDPTEVLGAANTQAWLDGYNAVTGLPMYDFGALETCQHPNACPDWSPLELWQDSSTRDSYALPEIYCTTEPAQWNELALWSIANEGTKLRLVGTLTASTAAAPGNCNAPIQPSDGFKDLQTLLNDDPPGTADPMIYSTDLTRSTT